MSLRSVAGAGLAGCALIAASCGTSGVTVEDGDTTANAAPAAKESVETSESTSTTPAPTTTTTLPVRRLELETSPSEAAISVEMADGSVVEATTPWAGDVVGETVVVTIEAEGYNTLVEEIATTDGAAESRMLWLDKDGQIVHKLAHFDVGQGPKGVAFTPDNSEVWVTLLAGTGLEIFDPRTGELIDSIQLGEHGSVEVLFTEDGSTAYVSQMETASVYEIDVATREIQRQMSTESTWSKVMELTSDESTLFVSNWVGNDVSEIDLATGEVIRRLPTVGTPRGLYVTPDDKRLYVAGFDRGQIQVWDLDTGESDVIHNTGGSARHIVGDESRDMIYVSDLSRDNVLAVDTTTNAVRELAKVDRKPNTIDISPDGRVLFVSNRGANNAESYYYPGPEWGTVLLVDTQTGAYLDAIVGGNQTTGLDLSPDGTLLGFSDLLDNTVTIYEVPPYDVLAAGGGGRYEAHRSELVK